ncbi:MAG: hypothetical protein L3J56_10765 [Bacteroidales bacterium]|nr:hypothetical protein [Bacteroidales bacterium]
MQEQQLSEESKDMLSDEEFLQRYDKRNKHEQRRNKYYKKDDKNTVNLEFWLFLTFVFIITYYLFSSYLFIPQP